MKIVSVKRALLDEYRRIDPEMSLKINIFLCHRVLQHKVVKDMESTI